jgi:putative ABC transport system ATP-binding protein
MSADLTAATAAPTPLPGADPDSPPADAVLELRAVTKDYPGDPPLRALDHVDLVVRRGELAVIVGPSGSGKSTLLHIIGTLDRATSGEVWVAGRDTATLSDAQLSALRARELGFVFQQFFLLNGMTAVDNVADGLLYTGLAQAERRRRATQALRDVGLGHRLRHDPNHLSGGERQRVAVARALVGRPSLVLADEPTGNLDSRSSAAIVGLLREVHAAGATIVVITHDREVAAELPRQVSMRDGRVEHDTHPGGAPAVRGDEARDGER